jgi:hypothetical protein
MPAREFAQGNHYPVVPEVCCASQSPPEPRVSFVARLPAARAELAKHRAHGDVFRAQKLEGGFWCRQI